MNVAYFTVTDQGEATAKKMTQHIPGPVIRQDVRRCVKEKWKQADALVFIMASGIVVRYIAPLIESKDVDPAVIVMDIHGRHVISLLSGHLGGANRLAVRLAEITGGTPVITTATDTEGMTAFDVVAGDNHMAIGRLDQLKYVSGALVAGRRVTVYTSVPVEGRFRGNIRCIPFFPDDKAIFAGKADGPIVVIDPLIDDIPGHVIYLRPKTLVVGVGCKRDMDPGKMLSAFEDFCRDHHIPKEGIRKLATADLKAEEPAICHLADRLGVPLQIISRDQISGLDLERIPGGAIEGSAFVKKVTGVGSISEASAYLASSKGRIRLPKTKYPGMTFALAEEMKAVII
ncbi:MAG TPA: cobalt-precorrin 5A hydrolase [Candidatus Onthocola gallistercoris]|uniref:Cobalt-precorrin 5A hydrolase n=1 Tax=Candidatus Onthocola gallistercoris TaxID=2840876 RepID=A0A9D1KXZ4_9FIRM|nr:cobalt-precorrin 5A hydrolase [Candidatus Onthocola gallistercoris]